MAARYEVLVSISEQLKTTERALLADFEKLNYRHLLVLPCELLEQTSLIASWNQRPEGPWLDTNRYLRSHCTANSVQPCAHCWRRILIRIDHYCLPPSSFTAGGR